MKCVFQGQRWLQVAVIAAFLAPLAVTAEGEPEVPKTVQVAFEGFTQKPALTETGEPILDEAGEPVMQRIALDDSVVTPGDQVLYVVTIDNPTTEPMLIPQLGVQVAAELLLDPYSFVGPEGLVLEWAGSEEPTKFNPVFVEVDGETVMNADLDDLRALRLTLPKLPPAEKASVEYNVSLR